VVKQNEKVEIGEVGTPVSFRIHDFETTKEAIVSIGYPKEPERLYLDIKGINQMIRFLKDVKNELKKVM
jgi:hypothetical protein